MILERTCDEQPHLICLDCHTISHYFVNSLIACARPPKCPDLRSLILDRVRGSLMLASWAVFWKGQEAMKAAFRKAADEVESNPNRLRQGAPESQQIIPGVVVENEGPEAEK